MSITQHSSSADSGVTDAIPIQLPHEPEEIAQQELEAFRKTTMAERGRLLSIACRSAVRLDRSRRQAGLPTPSADPWPESTWEFLKQQAARYALR